MFYKVFLLSNILILAFASNMIFNAESLIWIWTSNKQFAIEAAPFIPFLAIGMAVGSLQTIPYYIALANGFTRFNNYLGIISLVITFPGYWIMTKIYGSIGAAIVWCSVQTIATPIYLYLINKKFIQKESLSNLYFKKVLSPAFITVLVAFLFSKVEFFNTNRWEMLFWIGISTLITLIITLVIFFSKTEFLDIVNIKSNKEQVKIT